MAQQPEMDVPFPFQVSRLATSLWVPQVLHVAATLGVPDALAEGPRSVSDLASAVGANPDALARLLRAFAVLGFCVENADGRYELTPLGACLKSTGRDSVRSWVMLMGGERVWQAWGNLLECVRTGEPAFKLDGRSDAFEEIESNPQARAVFDRAMVELTRHIAGLIAMSYDFSGIRKIIDVGGGHGALLPPILAGNPEMHGAVFDMARCREGALSLFAKTGLAERCEFIAGDMFEAVPSGADAYTLKSVIHDWNDEKSLAILRRCREAMHDRARLLVIEPIVPERLGTSPLDAMLVSTDLNMLVNTGGRERTEAEYRKLIESAGLRVARIVSTPAAMGIIEARKG